MLFPLHVDQISTLPAPHILVKTISQVTIPPRTLTIVPTTFNNIPKPNCYNNFTEMPYKPQQNLFVVPVLKIFSEKLTIHLPCTIINTSLDNVILPKNWYIGKMILLNNSDDSWHPPSVSEVTHNISSDHTDVKYSKTDSFPPTSCKIHSNSPPIPETSVLMPSNLQVHRQVLLSNAKISSETRNAFYKLLQKYDPIISKSSNDIGQTGLLKIHIATSPDAAPIAAQPYSLALKHHKF